jgi:hypothetical protein
VARQIGGAGLPLTPEAPPEATFLANAVLERFIDWDEVRGESGEVRVVLRELGDSLAMPDSIPADASIAYIPVAATITDSLAALEGSRGVSPAEAGIWSLLVGVRGIVRSVPSLSLITLVPATRFQGGRLGNFRMGLWPRGEGAYAPPRGFVQVTPENMDTYVSTHFQLKDFLTKGQEGVWPKYVVLSPRLLDKLELTLQELESEGHPVEDVFVVSGFRTPWYNATGGDTQGRGALSRHMYGDAADIIVDNDHDGCLDDLTGDGKADINDVRVMVQAAEQVERHYPHLIGGIGTYRPVRGSHCGFVHIDTRGNRARW